MLKKQIRTDGPIRGVPLGLAVALLLTVGSAATIAVLILNGSISESAAIYYSLGGQFVSCLIGFVITGKVAKEKIAIRIGICAILYFVLMIGISLLILDERIKIQWGPIVVILISYVLACAICIRNGKFKRIKKRASW